MPLAIIPARFASTRFPGKPLVQETGKPLIQHVVEQARKARSLSRIVVATDDQRIFDTVSSFGAEVVMTRADHPNGTSRIAEAVENLSREGARGKEQGARKGQGGTSSPGPWPPAPGPDFDLIVNLQGDEPEIDPAVIDGLVAAMQADPAAAMGTVASPFAPGEDPRNPNIVKVVCDQKSRALYFSRALIPHYRGSADGPYFKHIGLYAYRRGFLAQYVKLPPTPLEQAEQLEQLRALEHGHPITVIIREVRHHGIDTPEQYADFVRRHR